MLVTKIISIASLFFQLINGDVVNLNIPCHNEKVCPKLTYDTTKGIPDSTTYRASLIINPNQNVKNIYAVFGSDEGTMYLPPSYNEIGYNNMGKPIGGIYEVFIDQIPELLFDSWLTIGITDGDINHQLSYVGIDFDSWTYKNALTINNGAIFLLNPEEITCQDECLIGQFTISDDISTNIIINVQGRKINEDPLNMNDNAWTEYNIVFPINSKTGPHQST